jgi:hypothetical protein
MVVLFQDATQITANVTAKRLHGAGRLRKGRAELWVSVADVDMATCG